MIYVFDTNSLRVMGSYFPERFPSFWGKMNQLISDGRIISVKEVYSELEHQAQGHLLDWVQSNKRIFLPPNPEETEFVGEIFKNAHFLQLVSSKAIAKGTAVADPFVVASAKIKNACVVTEEARKEHAAKIPNICEHYDISYTNLDGFMGIEGWRF